MQEGWYVSCFNDIYYLRMFTHIHQFAGGLYKNMHHWAVTDFLHWLWMKCCLTHPDYGASLWKCPKGFPLQNYTAAMNQRCGDYPAQKMQQQQKHKIHKI